MDTLTFNRVRNGYVIWAIVYVILSLIGGSINCAEWSVNAWLLFSLAATARIHLAMKFKSML